MDILTFGEILVDFFPAEVGRRLTDVSSFFPKPGGAPANVAVAAARLGKESAFIGKVGDDAFGHSLIRVLHENGVETRGMRVDAHARTTLAFIAMPDENNAEFVFYRNPGADLCLSPDELDTELITSARVLHCGSLSLVAEPARSAQYRAVEIARQHGAMISFDVNFRPSLWNSRENALKQIQTMIPAADILKVNLSELALITGSSDPKIGGTELLKRGVDLVAITLGANGSYFCSPAAEGYCPPFKVQTVDAIGCGDAFIAGLLSALVEAGQHWLDLTEKELYTMFRYANAVGAVTALSHGVIPALPSANRVAEFLEQYTSPA